jgi:hypothetical protein
VSYATVCVSKTSGASFDEVTDVELTSLLLDDYDPMVQRVKVAEDAGALTFRDCRGDVIAEAQGTPNESCS